MANTTRNLVTLLIMITFMNISLQHNFVNGKHLVKVRRAVNGETTEKSSVSENNTITTEMSEADETNSSTITKSATITKSTTTPKSNGVQTTSLKLPITSQPIAVSGQQNNSSTKQPEPKVISTTQKSADRELGTTATDKISEEDPTINTSHKDSQVKTNGTTTPSKENTPTSQVKTNGTTTPSKENTPTSQVKENGTTTPSKENTPTSQVKTNGTTTPSKENTPTSQVKTNGTTTQSKENTVTSQVKTTIPITTEPINEIKDDQINIDQKKDQNLAPDNIDDKPSGKKTIQSGANMYDEEESGGHFMAYFMTFVVICVAGYIIYHNKQKILAFILEGRKEGGTKRRPSSKEYKRLKTEEVMPSLEKTAPSNKYIY